MSVFTIIVTYNPNSTRLAKMLASILPQVDECVLVDNGSTEFRNMPNHVHVISLGNNCGIAYAQNRGIEYALEKGADWILLSDQDTIYPPNYVKTLLKEGAKLSNIGCLVPVFYDEVKQTLSKICITKNHAIIPEEGKVYELAHAISSGTLIPAEVLKKVGLMNEKFFIDWVDNEWCWRVTKAGYKIYSPTNVKITHQLGDGVIKLGKIKLTKRSVFRFYYILRNGFYLLTTDLLSKKEKFLFGKFMCRKFIECFIVEGFSLRTMHTAVLAVHNGLHGRFENFNEMENKSKLKVLFISNHAGFSKFNAPYFDWLHEQSNIGGGYSGLQCFSGDRSGECRHAD